MSWQATAWAQKQRTGSPHAKLLLLLLANYADEDGICWPSQSTLAEASEQSPDTVQRHLEKLETVGLIRRERQNRTRGQWLGYVYQLMMPGVTDHAAGSGLVKKPAEKRARQAAVSGLTKPQRAASPGRRERPYPSIEPPIEPSGPNPVSPQQAESARPGREVRRLSVPSYQPNSRPVDEARSDLEIAKRLGADGWNVLVEMSNADLDALRRRHRSGALTDNEINMIAAKYRSATSTRVRSKECCSKTEQHSSPQHLGPSSDP